ncbi:MULTISPECIES: amidohydrolase [Myxococcaceae]|uniref:amidohydrolase n=1 Tax=Myxococcaceae TaxID=31 RepID=UPI00188F6851|nr:MULTISPECIES: amidohydrolase [Myxococcaceae]MBF5043502.1 amidohydrolase [Simulacricoccus sp. 17bor-14]
MRPSVRLTLLPLLLALGACARHAAAPSPQAAAAAPAEATGPVTVYVAARVRTLDPAHPLAAALAVRGEKLLAVGSRADVLKAAGEGARVVDLGPATLVPGLTDAHGHLSALGGSLVGVQLEGTASLEEALARIFDAPASASQGEWRVGRGWDQNDWPTRAFPGRAELDARLPHTPVAMGRIDGHALWVNGEALRRAGITRDTKDPEGGRILRGPDGEPTGVLVDNAMGLVYRAIPEPTDAQREARMLAALQHCAEAGLTGVHDAGMSLADYRVLQRLDAAGKLPLRVYVMADGRGQDKDAFLQLGPQQGHLLTMRAVKFTMDGALGSRGAALHEPYSDAPGERGLLVISPEEYDKRARAFMARGFQVATHAIGDRANTLVLDVLTRAADDTHTRNLRHRVEHAQIMRLEDIDRLGRDGFIASVQPTHATSDMPWAEDRVGHARLAGAYAWQRLKAAGAPLALGSDFPVERPDVIPGLYAARTRQDAQGNPKGGWLPEQRLTGEEALAGFTTGAAYASFAEDKRGRLEPGMDADFVALSVDPVDAPAQQLVGASVRLVATAGREVYRAP